MFGLRSLKEIETALAAKEAQIGKLRCEQAVLINELRHVGIGNGKGCRSVVDWVVARLDIRRSLAIDLVLASRKIGWHRYINHSLAEGRYTFDRALALLRMAEAGASQDDVERAEQMDLVGVQRVTTNRRRMTRRDEQDVHAERYVSVRTSLDESSFRIDAHLPGIDGRVVEKALCQRADELRKTAGDLPAGRGQLMADALTSIAQDSLDRDLAESTASGPHVTVFVDATRRNPSEVTAEIEFGPRIGPSVLEAIICTGSVSVVGLDHGTPIVTSRSSRAIPPAVRDAVALRDGACTIDGCASLYRLEPHHIRPWSHGGSHDMGNLATLCWYHHHVAVHGEGYVLDEDSPPTRRTLTKPTAESRFRPRAGP